VISGYVPGGQKPFSRLGRSPFQMIFDELRTNDELGYRRLINKKFNG